MEYRFAPAQGIPGTSHVGNVEVIAGSLLQQGTHMDALGHFGALPEPWDGQQPFPGGEARYYGGLAQDAVKPSPEGGLARLGIDAVPPILTGAVLLDAAGLKEVATLEPGYEITAEDITAMLDRQRLTRDAIAAGDVVLIHTGWDRYWGSDEGNHYYHAGPGLSLAGARFLAEYEPSVVGLDNPFTDPVSAGQLTGQAAAPAGMPAGQPFGTHHFNLVEAGILQIQNLKLGELARDRAWLSAIAILPLRVVGGSGSPVRPVAFGNPA